MIKDWQANMICKKYIKKITQNLPVAKSYIIYAALLITVILHIKICLFIGSKIGIMNLVIF
jgi:hypothetical protein